MGEPCGSWSATANSRQIQASYISGQKVTGPFVHCFYKENGGRLGHIRENGGGGGGVRELRKSIELIPGLQEGNRQNGTRQ